MQRIIAAGDIEEDALCARYRDFQQRARDRSLRGLHGADPNYRYGTHFLFQGHEGAKFGVVGAIGFVVTDGGTNLLDDPVINYAARTFGGQPKRVAAEEA